MKGIVLAGGLGTRLYPLTIPASKQLLPVYDKPMIYYPVSVLMLAGIRDILIICTPEHMSGFKKLLRTGEQFGVRFKYAEQPQPKGIAEAFIIGDEFIGEDNVCLVLGDNIFFGQELKQKLQESANIKEGAIIFGYYVNDPKRYGVVEFDKNFNVLSIEEKPHKPKSCYAITGIYFYDKNVVEIAKNLKPSGRGELEITDINKAYLKKNMLKLLVLGRGIAWLDTGTQDFLLEAGNFVHAIEKRQGLKIACLEEIALRMGYITFGQFEKIAENYQNSFYGEYLRDLSEKIKNGLVFY